MNISESLQSALDSINMNKVRSALTMLGIIIGVASVIALVSLGEGFGNNITTEFSAQGAELLTVATERDVSQGYETLTLADLTALQKAPLPAVQAIGALLQAQESVSAQGHKQLVGVQAVTANYFAMNNISTLQAGQLFTADQARQKDRVVVLGADLATDLFGNNNQIVGESIRIAGSRYQVVGVIAKSNDIRNTSNNALYIPFEVGVTRLHGAETRNGETALSRILIAANNAESIDAANIQVATILRNQHNLAYGIGDDFTITSQASLLESVGNITGTLTLVVGAIAGISLVVGGIGIMNIMLVSVTERTREIGIRKAVGALRRDILVQFLVESVLLCLLGGALGMALGVAMALLAGNFAGVQPSITINTVLFATGFSAAVGIIFGLYPAWRAAQLRPIQALRYE